MGFLVIVFFLATFCFSCFESTLPLLVGANFHLDFKRDATSASTVGYLFVYCGLIGALVQGGAIGRLVKKMGEPKLIALSLVLTAASFAWIPVPQGRLAAFLEGAASSTMACPGCGSCWRSRCCRSAPASRARRCSACSRT